ncbi:hypothetical protein PVL29_016940 [Vitis rotundifolia]|uniref:Carboxypeptidase n=1 Tax=Vitis rotundifolia TaxID=103349 RepID=A0AA39DID3_VITRO|nr:hypothetical protein PVL29_016940 [Vitis rotundifolia]
MENSVFLSLLSLFLVVLSPLSSVNGFLRPSLNPKFPTLQAEKLIRELNLFPKDAEAVNGMDWEGESLKKLVERRLRFPGIDYNDASVKDLSQHAGYYKLRHSLAARMFYLFFESRDSRKDPVVIWLTGGPGCGSELALFYENGPFTIAANMSLMWNDWGWDKISNLLYVDQPIGTGFSYSSDLRDIRHNEEAISNDLFDFLQAFFEEHPLFTNNDFYIAGESYAGHYIPALAARIQRGNKAKGGIHINLKGFAIGNGLTNPQIQYKAYTDYALEMGMIEKTDYDRINKVLPVCEMAIKLCGTDGTISCMASYFVCNSIFSKIMALAGDTNYYDIRKTCEGSLCYDFSNMEKFLNQKPVRAALGVGDIEFVPCSPAVYQALLMDWMRNLEVGIPDLLDDGIKLLVYAGEYDLICNWLGNSRWVHAMEWGGQLEFQAAPEVPFVIGDSKAGLMKIHGPLTFLKVHDAGHMVPMDQPRVALEMLKRWFENKLPENTPAESKEPEKRVAQM